MASDDNDNVIKFPGSSVHNKDTSQGKEFLDAIKEIVAAPSVDASTPSPPTDPTPPKRRRATPVAQSIMGDGNTQVSENAVHRQSISGNNNTQVSGSVQNLNIIHGKSVNIKLTPPNGSIGGSPLLKERVTEAFNKLGLAREGRVGKTAYSVMYSTFKKDFNIPKELAWTTIWTWPEARAEDILTYLHQKHGETILGRMEKAAKKPGYQHSRGHLFRIERELLDQLGLDPKSEDVKNKMKLLLGTDTHKELTPRQHANWVAHLEGLVDKIYEPKN